MTVENMSGILGILFLIGLLYILWKPSNKKIELFWKYFFHWKYMVFLSIIILVAYTYSVAPSSKNGTNILTIFFLIITAIALRRYNAVFWKKGVMFILYIIVTVGVYFGASYIFYNMGSNANTRIINNMLIQNKNMPKMANENIQVLKYSSTSSDNITMHLKFIDYDKQSIIKEFLSLDDFGKNMLKEELKSCDTQNMKEILKYGLTMNMIYYDKNNTEISKIFINNELCKPYYKTD